MTFMLGDRDIVMQRGTNMKLMQTNSNECVEWMTFNDLYQ